LIVLFYWNLNAYFVVNFTGKYRIEEREIRARMDSPNIRKVLELGFSRDVVMNTLRKRLRETG
jgi:hypothetical protein